MFPADSLKQDMEEFHRCFNQLVCSDSSQISHLSDIINYLISSPGKHIRPQLFLSFCSLFGCLDNNRFKIAVAAEYIHTASLIHDDIIDDAVRRRNKRPLYLEWSIKTAILIGDFIYSRAFEILGQAGNNSIVNIFANAANRLSVSEINQLGSESELQLLEDEARFINIMEEKTAVLFGAFCEAAAVFSMKEKYCQQTRQFGMNIGMAFQLCDDLLDYNTANYNWGKTSLQDLGQGKITLPLVYTYKEVTDTQKKQIREVIQNPEISTKKFENVVNMVQSGQSLNLIRNLAKDFCHKARQELQSLPSNDIHKSLVYLTQSIVNRRY